jgi:hypothetical protein
MNMPFALSTGSEQILELPGRTFIVKVVQSIIFAFESACLFYLLYGGTIVAFNQALVVSLCPLLLNGLQTLRNQGIPRLGMKADGQGPGKATISSGFRREQVFCHAFGIMAPLFSGEVNSLLIRYFTGL